MSVQEIMVLGVENAVFLLELPSRACLKSPNNLGNGPKLPKQLLMDLQV